MAAFEIGVCFLAGRHFMFFFVNLCISLKVSVLELLLHDDADHDHVLRHDVSILDENLCYWCLHVSQMKTKMKMKR